MNSLRFVKSIFMTRKEYIYERDVIPYEIYMIC